MTTRSLESIILSVFIYTIIQAVGGSPDVIHLNDLKSRTRRSLRLGYCRNLPSKFLPGSRSQRDTSSRQTAGPHMYGGAHLPQPNYISYPVDDQG